MILGGEASDMTIESIGDITILAIPSQDGTSDEYNMSIQPDIYETNPDIIKAELSFYTTPHSADYGQAVYYTLKNIETTCAYDYTKFCSVPSTTVMSFEFIRSRALAHASPAGRSDTSMTRASRDVKRIMEGKRSMSHGMPIPIENNPESSINSRKSRRLRGDTDKEEGPNRASGGSHWGPPPSPVPEDNLFAGSLGYGITGDTCMYQNFESLMPNCQSSVGDLFMLRNQYWEEESFVNSRRGPPKEFFLLWVLLLMGISLAVGISLRRRRHGMKETRAILKAIQANPALAAQVEAESGVTISSLGSFKGQKLPCSGLAFLIRVVLIGITMHFVLTLICLISFTLVQLVSGAHPSDSPLACVIFFSAAVLQIAAVFYGLNRARRNTRSSSGSQPPEPTVATAVLFKAPNPDDRQSKLQSIENCGPMMSFSTTTSATVSSNASNGIFNAMKNAITGTAAPAAADGAYSALGTEESVHSSHQKSVVIVGTPIGTHQQSTTNWI